MNTNMGMSTIMNIITSIIITITVKRTAMAG